MWSRVAVFAMVAACYSPRAPSGAPCDPLVGNCPSGLMCYPVGGEYRCLAGPPGEDAAIDDAPIDDAAFDAPSDAMVDAMIDAMPDAMPMPMTLMYTAVVADCVEAGAPDPDECRDANDNSIGIDADDAGDEWVGYVRFDIDNMPAGKTVQSVKLRMTVTADPSAVSGSSGAVWQVQPFTRLSLFTSEPAHVGGTPIVPDQGGVDPNDVIEWPLPTTIVTANAGVFLSIDSADTDGTAYGNLSSTFPPKLIVVVQ